ncbi:MmgE/PrpD family protein [Alicycliphilus denitrificans]|uniref:MmgE/PrpD family protein n=1 Tax=Alicycliphilus denitrificans TaxID=179636 RepID=UPI0015E1107F|nr:MmgE/PrpD family protein [Alicycliphilus denitrificans]
MSGSGLTRALAAFVAGLRTEHVPPAARQEACRAMADCLGGAVAGARDEVARIAAATQARPGGACILWGTGLRADVHDAALVNGCAAHAHALDDTHESMRGHPSAPLVPAILAVGELVDAGGDDLATAYIAGAEVACRLGRSVNDRHSQLGWHTTGTLGPVGAAAACAWLLRLDAGRTAHALGIAASMAGGLRVNFGTMAKALHAGMAAQHGVQAARLAAGGMTASTAALEGYEGFLQLFCDDGSQDAARALRGLGRHFEVLTPGIVYKQYPTCSLMHALIDMVLQARAQGLLTPADGLELRCAISQRLEAVRGKDWPATGLAAKFCVEYCVAVAVQEGSQGIADFTDAAIHRPGLRELAQRVRLSQGQDFPPGNGDCAELVVLRDGREVLRRRQAKPCGHPSMPLSPAQHEAKFMACAAPVLGTAKARRLLQALHSPQPCSARELARALALPCA